MGVFRRRATLRTLQSAIVKLLGFAYRMVNARWQEGTTAAMAAAAGGDQGSDQHPSSQRTGPAALQSQCPKACAEHLVLNLCVSRETSRG